MENNKSYRQIHEENVIRYKKEVKKIVATGTLMFMMGIGVANIAQNSHEIREGKAILVEEYNKVDALDDVGVIKGSTGFSVNRGNYIFQDLSEATDYIINALKDADMNDAQIYGLLCLRFNKDVADRFYGERTNKELKNIYKQAYHEAEVNRLNDVNTLNETKGVRK